MLISSVRLTGKSVRGPTRDAADLCERARFLQLSAKLSVVAELATDVILNFSDDTIMPQQY